MDGLVVLALVSKRIAFVVPNLCKLKIRPDDIVVVVRDVGKLKILLGIQLDSLIVSLDCLIILAFIIESPSFILK